MPSLPHRSSNGPTQQQRDRWRGKTKDRGYDADWKCVRIAKLAADPFCEIRTNCMGEVATEVDHIIAIAERPELRLEWSNLQSSCKACNVAKAQRNRGQSRAIPAGNTRFVSLQTPANRVT